MATKSILKTVTINTPKKGSSLADALEKSVKQKKNNVKYKVNCSEVKKGNVNKFFDNHS